MPATTPFFIARDPSKTQNPAIVCQDREISYDLFFRVVLTAEERLRKLGIKQHDRVGISSPNSIHYVTVLFALWRIGAVSCLFSTRLPESALGSRLRCLQCACLLTPNQKLLISETMDITKFDIHDVGMDAADTGLDYSLALDQEATIIFTSGSSQEPKAVMHTLGNHYYSAKGSNEHLPVIPGDRWLLSLPLYHVGGLGIVFRAFLGGGSVIIPGADEAIEDSIKRCQATHISLVPTQFDRLLRDKICVSKLKAFKVILLGGSAIPDPLIRDAIELGLPVYTTYGLTEMASQVATSLRLSQKNPISAGKILNYRQLIISESGEIYVKGETLFRGYVDGDCISMPINRNGYFATGDIGEFADNGRLIVKGRKDNMFISGGENIQPEEIEYHLCRIKNIERAVVVPITHQEFGFRPVAFIKVNKPLTRKEILTHLNDALEKFKIPEAFYKWPKDDIEGDFKIHRQYLASRFAEQPASFTMID
ncbi:MAG: o-succinylbenzoate--CoA ligase [Candidatus Omnitrophica bacterium]|nr:o-succinylbenzoate--CoA ligase [Candidatus Omnitrophota bacterium]